MCPECPPKWKIAVEVLAEIKADFDSKRKTAAPRTPTLRGEANRVLFVVKDSLALLQLRDVLVCGIDSVCDSRCVRTVVPAVCGVNFLPTPFFRLLLLCVLY